jgi:glycerol-3-phosphate dehydrogenase subunit B
LPPDSFELLSTPPSPHGWRLQQAIGLGSIKATVQSVESTRGRITSVRAGDRSLRGDAFILATGHHIGGGLDGGRVTSEPLLNLGVFHDGETVATSGTRLQHLQYIDPAEALRSGLRTDSQLHPLDEGGQLPYTNLYAAGAVLGGYDYAGACGFGVPILTGWLAGRWAAKL